MITCVYVFPTGSDRHLEDACRFIASYNICSPLAEHRLVIIANGGTLSFDQRSLFDTLEHSYEVFIGTNRAWDISAFQEAAKAFPCEMMVFFGTTAYLRRPGWLARMYNAFTRNGPQHLYGSTANQGDPRVNVFPHIRTTGFWCSPDTVNRHPLRAADPSMRYPYEHGANCLTQWVRSQGRRALMATWDSEYDWPNWDSIANGFHRGNQSDLIVGDRLTAPPYYPVP